MVFPLRCLIGAFHAPTDALGLEVAHGLLGVISVLLLAYGFWKNYDSWSNFGK